MKIKGFRKAVKEAVKETNRLQKELVDGVAQAKSVACGKTKSSTSKQIKEIIGEFDVTRTLRPDEDGTFEKAERKIQSLINSAILEERGKTIKLLNTLLDVLRQKIGGKL
jgi:hypothetical protein